MKQSMRMQALKRNAFYWGRYAEITVGTILLVSLFYGVLFTSFPNSGYETASQLIDAALEIRFYVMMMGIVIPVINCVSYSVAGMGITIAFGGKRSEVLWGIQWMNWLVNLQIFFLISLINLIAGENLSWAGLYFFLVLIITSLAQIALGMFLKFGRKGVLLTVMLIVLMLVAIGAVVGIRIVTDAPSGKILGLAITEIVKYTMGLAAVVGVVLYLVSLFVLKKVLSKYEVKL